MINNILAEIAIRTFLLAGGSIITSGSATILGPYSIVAESHFIGVIIGLFSVIGIGMGMFIMMMLPFKPSPYFDKGKIIWMI